MVGEAQATQAQLGVYLGLVGGIGVAQHAEQARQVRNDGCELIAAHRLDRLPGCGGLLGRLVLGTFGFGLGDPVGDGGGVGAGVECGPVLGEPAVAVRDLAADVVVVLGLGLERDRSGEEFVYGGREVRGLELAGQPFIQRRQQCVLPQGHVQRVVELVGQGVLGGEPAAVVGRVVGPVALHAPLA